MVSPGGQTDEKGSPQKRSEKYGVVLVTLKWREGGQRPKVYRKQRPLFCID